MASMKIIQNLGQSLDMDELVDGKICNICCDLRSILDSLRNMTWTYSFFYCMAMRAEE
jgi:hypothetical protein